MINPLPSISQVYSMLFLEEKKKGRFDPLDIFLEILPHLLLKFINLILLVKEGCRRPKEEWTMLIAELTK